MDDICIYSSHLLHCEKLEKVLGRLPSQGGEINPRKCFFAMKRNKLLGHIVLEKGIQANEDKVKALLLLPPPIDVKQLIIFTQKVNYTSCFIFYAFKGTSLFAIGSKARYFEVECSS